MSLRPRLAVALLLLTACGGPTSPAASPATGPRADLATTAAPPSPAPPAPAAAPGEAATAAFVALRDRLIDAWLADDPAWARYLGLHDGDGKVADLSAAALEARVARLRAEHDALAGIAAAELAPDDALDLALMRREVELRLFKLVDLDVAHRLPQTYEELFAVNGYLDRDYAPIAERAARLLAHEKAALVQAPHAFANLTSPLSRSIAQTAVGIFHGYAEYLRGDVLTQLRGVGGDAFQRELRTTTEALAKQADALAARMKLEAKRGDDSHVLGPDRFRKLLAVQEALDVPLDDFRRMGEENLASNRAAFEALAKAVEPTRPKVKELLAAATRLTDEARRFVVDRGLVSIPSEDRAEVRESPPYQRWNAAFLDASGPFEKAKSAFYYITLPDPKWSAREQAGYVPTRGVLSATTVHEVWPGHFLQGRWVERAPTRMQKMIDTYSFVEGWAHYAEQLMVEEGFRADDPETRLGQLSDALLRNCRMVVAVGVHAQGMSLAEAERRFVDDCHQDRATAREQAARAAFDPGYFAYTLGKLQILALREDAKRAAGDRFSLRRFHDALLAHGSPPVALVRQRVLDEVTATR